MTEGVTISSTPIPDRYLTRTGTTGIVEWGERGSEGADNGCNGIDGSQRGFIEWGETERRGPGRGSVWPRNQRAGRPCSSRRQDRSRRAVLAQGQRAIGNTFQCRAMPWVPWALVHVQTIWTPVVPRPKARRMKAPLSVPSSHKTGVAIGYVSVVEQSAQGGGSGGRTARGRTI
jgi:hypothetical protein